MLTTEHGAPLDPGTPISLSPHADYFYNRVLNPFNPTATPIPSLKTQPPAWPSAHSTPGGIPFTSGVALETAVVTVTATATPIPTEIPIPSDASAVRPWFEPFREDRKKRPIWVSVVWGLGMAMVFAVLMA
jgi:hypothetical protein